jgi:hypothetical protein
MNADCWRLPGGRIGTEVARREVEGRVEILLVMPDRGFPLKAWHPLADLQAEPSRYEGARGGRH